MNPVTWAEMAMLEPALAELEADVVARVAALAAEPDFCRVDEFYGNVKPRLFYLVGWQRKASAERPVVDTVLWSSDAYDAAYDHLLELLPPCRGARCLCAGAPFDVVAANVVTGQEPPRARPRWSADDPQVEQLLDDLLGSQGLRSDGRGRRAIGNNWERLEERVESVREWWRLAEAELLVDEDHDARRVLLAAGDVAVAVPQDTVAAMRDTLAKVAAADAFVRGPSEFRELCLRAGREDLSWFVEQFDAAADDASPLRDADAYRAAVRARLSRAPG